MKEGLHGPKARYPREADSRTPRKDIGHIREGGLQGDSQPMSPGAGQGTEEDSHIIEISLLTVDTWKSQPMPSTLWKTWKAGVSDSKGLRSKKLMV